MNERRPRGYSRRTLLVSRYAFANIFAHVTDLSAPSSRSHTSHWLTQIQQPREARAATHDAYPAKSSVQPLSAQNTASTVGSGRAPYGVQRTNPHTTT